MISDIETDDVASISSAFKIINVEMTLTETGLQSYRKVIALLFEYKKKLEGWLLEGKALDVWLEEKTVSNLKYDVYSSRPADEHVCEISQAMLSFKESTKIIKRT